MFCTGILHSFCAHLFSVSSFKIIHKHFYTGTWEWLSDSPSLLPPCSDAVSYYSKFGRIPGFTSTAGRRFRGILEEHLQLLRWPDGVKASIK